MIGCPLGAIVKSLVFQLETTEELIMVLVSGQNHVDTHHLSKQIMACVQPAKPATILTKTGYPVGAVPPLALNNSQPVYMDADLLQYDQVWASAGAKHIVVGFTPADLQSITCARVESLKA